MGQPQQPYNPMVDFYRRAFDLLFKQAPVIVLAVFGLALLWQKTERLETQRIKDRIEVRAECAEVVADIRDDLKHCITQKDTLIALYTRQAVELAAVRAVQRRWARSFGKE